MSECYGMSEDLIYFGGLPVSDPEKRLTSDTLRQKLLEQREELLAIGGFKLVRIRVPEDGGSIRYDIQFAIDTPSFKARTALEMKHWDVGQEMADRQLHFYVTKRSEKSDGWES
jgi:hypothetical protein